MPLGPKEAPSCDTGPRSAVGNMSDCRHVSDCRSHTFVEVDYEISSTAILLPSTDSRKVFAVCARSTG